MNETSGLGNSLSVRLQRENAAVHFSGTQGTHVVHLDGSPELGGENKGFRPTELLLYAVGGCAMFDFVSMIYRQGIAVQDVSADISGTRQAEGSANPFVDIHIKFVIVGQKSELDNYHNVIQLFAKRAVRELCSVGLTIRKETSMRHAVEFSYAP